MTALDFAVLGILLLSTLLAYLRGVIREVVAVVTWIVGFIAALAFGPVVAAYIPGLEAHPLARHLIACALVFIAVLVVGAIVAYLLSKLVRAVGLGFLDRFLGALFGVARGVVIVLILVLVAGLTSLPRSDWWQNSLLAPPAVAAALSLSPWLPQAWADRLDYSATGRPTDKPALETPRKA
jgi:membrane protein required for colicin V production